MNRGTPTQSALPLPQNPLHTTFKNPHFPANCITEHNVLDYFCNTSNIFYDTKSCNQVLKMQNIYRPLDECLMEMTGDQYVTVLSRPPLFVILKLRRASEHSITPLVYYYVINGVVYQAPDAYSLVQSRLLAAVDPLRQAFDKMTKYSRFNVANGYSWQFDAKPAEDDEEEAQDMEGIKKGKGKKGEDEGSSNGMRTSAFQKTRTMPIMKILYDQFPPPTGPPLLPVSTPSMDPSVSVLPAPQDSDTKPPHKRKQ